MRRRTRAVISLAAVPLVVAPVLVVCPVGAAPAYADDVRDAQWHVDYLDLAAAHELTRGSGVTVAIIDSGVDARHRDLRDNLLPGIDLVDPENENAWTAEQHGTLVAGVLAGHGHGPGGGDGVLGIAPDATILPIRASPDEDDGDGDGDTEQPTSHRVADGIRHAVANRASVINISLSSDYHELDERAIAAARRTDAVVVAAAGNQPDAEGVTFPASLPTVVAVGGTGEDGGLAEFSVTGPEIALTAPADEIVTTLPGDEYGVASGTSFAAPVVAGAAALVRARFPDLSADEVVHRLVTTAADSGPAGRDEQYGHGIVDIAAALTADVPAMPPVPDEPDEVRQAEWHLRTLGLPAAHAIAGGEGVTVGLVGSGVDASHPDLHGNVLPGVDLAEPANDDAWTPTASGTALAGIIAGHGNRLTDQQPGNRGVLGVAPAAQLLPVRVTGSARSDREAVELAAGGIEWAVANGAQVICYVAGRASQDLFADAIEAARAADVLVVAAAGDRPGPAEVWFPAANPAVVAVTAVDRDGNHAEGAVSGPEVALAAPGADLVATLPDDGYTGGGGAAGGDTGSVPATSVAAAVVAGAAALVRAAHPDLTADQVVHRLVATSDDAGPAGRDERFGHGILDLTSALTADVPPPTSPPAAGPPGPDANGDPPPSELNLESLQTVVLVLAVAAAVLGTILLVVHRRRDRRSRPDDTDPDSW